MIVAIAEASLPSVISVNSASDTGTDDRSHGEFHDKPHVKVKQLTRLKWLWSPILTWCAQIYIFTDIYIVTIGVRRDDRRHGLIEAARRDIWYCKE